MLPLTPPIGPQQYFGELPFPAFCGGLYASTDNAFEEIRLLAFVPDTNLELSVACSPINAIGRGGHFMGLT